MMDMEANLQALGSWTCRVCHATTLSHACHPPHSLIPPLSRYVLAMLQLRSSLRQKDQMKTPSRRNHRVRSELACIPSSGFSGVHLLEACCIPLHRKLPCEMTSGHAQALLQVGSMAPLYPCSSHDARCHRDGFKVVLGNGCVSLVRIRPVT